MRRRTTLALGAATAALAALPGRPAHAQRTLTMATGDAIGSLRNQLGNWVRDQLEARAAPVRVKHIEGPVLGNAAQITDQAIAGTLDLVGFDAAWLTPYTDILKTTSFAFVYRSADHVQKVIDSPLMAAAVEDTAQRHGVRVLGLRKLPARTFFARRPILQAADLAGLKVRSPQLAVWIESYKSLGANPTPVNWNETFLALKTGLVDAAHGLPADVLANKWHLAAPHITALDDMFAIHAWFINEKRWQALSGAEKAALAGMLGESMRWLAERSDELDLNAITTMLKEGEGTFVSPSAARREQVTKVVGADRVKAFPEADLARLRAGALEAARRLEGGKDWWAKGLVDQIDAIG